MKEWKAHARTGDEDLKNTVIQIKYILVKYVKDNIDIKIIINKFIRLSIFFVYLNILKKLR